MRKRMLLAMAACGMLVVAMGGIVGGAVSAVNAIGGGVPVTQMPTIAGVKAMPIASKDDCVRLLGEPGKRERHHDYEAPYAFLAEHWDYFQSASEQGELIDIVVWWRPDGTLTKICFRNSETGEVLR